MAGEEFMFRATFNNPDVELKVALARITEREVADVWIPDNSTM
jgi:hypothetical protein